MCKDIHYTASHAGGGLTHSPMASGVRDTATRPAVRRGERQGSEVTREGSRSTTVWCGVGDDRRGEHARRRSPPGQAGRSWRGTTKGPTCRQPVLLLARQGRHAALRRPGGPGRRARRRRPSGRLPPPQQWPTKGGTSSLLQAPGAVGLGSRSLLSGSGPAEDKGVLATAWGPGAVCTSEAAGRAAAALAGCVFGPAASSSTVRGVLA